MNKEKLMDLVNTNFNKFQLEIKRFYKEEYVVSLEQKCKKQKEVIDKAINELFILKDMIYKPETREKNFGIQRKISSLIKRLNGKEVSE